jgi:hypothetical protein
MMADINAQCQFSGLIGILVPYTTPPLRSGISTLDDTTDDANPTPSDACALAGRSG